MEDSPVKMHASKLLGVQKAFQAGNSPNKSAHVRFIYLPFPSPFKDDYKRYASTGIGDIPIPGSFGDGYILDTAEESSEYSYPMLLLGGISQRVHKTTNRF